MSLRHYEGQRTMSTYKTLAGAQRYCRPGHVVRRLDDGAFKICRASAHKAPAELTHSERLVLSLRHHTERQTRAMTAIGGRPDYSALRDACQCIANLKATMTPDEIAAASATP